MTADHNVVKEEGELRNKQRYANCCTQWISKLPMQNKIITRNGEKSGKLLDLEKNTKDVYTNDSMTFGKAGEDLPWNHCSSAPHRPETNRIAERAIRRVKEGPSSVLLQSRLDEQLWAESMECHCYLRNVQDLSSDGETLHCLV